MGVLIGRLLVRHRVTVAVRAEHNPKDARRAGRRTILGAATAVVLAAAAAGTGAAAFAEQIPPPTVDTVATLPSVVPGPRPVLPWPSAGEAALETTSGVSFGTSGPDTPAPIASLTKVMTAYVVLSDHPLQPGQSGPPIVVSAAQAATTPTRLRQGQSILRVAPGERLSELQALQALLIPSADNVADILAAYDSGTPARFVAKMNRAALALGMSHTHYADPSGLDPASVSTAADQAILGRAVLKVPVLAEIAAQPAVALPLAGTVYNYNALVGHDGYQGIKTGSTNAAGGCLLFAATRTVDGRPVTIVGAVLGQRRGPYIAAALNAAQALTDAAFASFGPRTVLPAATPILRIDQAGQHTFARTTTALSTIDPPGTPVAFTVADTQPPTVRQGAPIAALTVHCPGETATTGVGLAGPIPPPSLRWRLDHLL